MHLDARQGLSWLRRYACLHQDNERLLIRALLLRTLA